MKLAKEGYFYVMHRFAPETRLDFVRRFQEAGAFASISVGIKQEEYDFIDQLKTAGLTPEYITIDIAHGHSDAVIKMIQYIKLNLPAAFVIAGNVATPEAVRDFALGRCDRLGVGPERACIKVEDWVWYWGMAIGCVAFVREGC